MTTSTKTTCVPTATTTSAPAAIPISSPRIFHPPAHGRIDLTSRELADNESGEVLTVDGAMIEGGIPEGIHAMDEAEVPIEVIRNDEMNEIGELSKGAEKDNFSSDVTEAILNKQSITRRIANILIEGLPGSGKTSLLDRLLNKPLADHSSTGICDGIVIVDISPTSTHTSAYTSYGNTWKVTDFNKSMVSQLDTCRVFITRETLKDSNFPIPYEKASRLEPVRLGLEQNVKKVLGKHNITNIEDLQTKSCLYIRDTGGQVEFQESLSLLIFGPSIFIFVMKTDVDIHTKTTIQYRTSNGKIINNYESSISVLDALIQFLTSVSAIQTTENSVFRGDGKSVCHEPIVFIVGTHIDKLRSEAHSILKDINKILHEMIFERNFTHFIRYANPYQNRVLYEIDNTSSEDQYFQCLRSDICQYIQDRDEFLVKYPVSYLLFCLELQNIDKSVLSMDDCKKLAKKFNIAEEEIGSLLHFLHFRVGIILHYDVKGISDVIIKEPQILFDKVTEIMLKTFLSPGAMPISQHNSFCKKGILEVSAFENLLGKKDQISSEQFLMFLLHLRIAVPFTDKAGVMKYFIPSVLSHVEKSASDTTGTDISPLAVTFQLGHCPKGLFGMLITYLMSPEENQDFTFDLLEDHVYQDEVSLLVNLSEEADKICIRSHLSHLEVNVVLENYAAAMTDHKLYVPRSTTPSEVCCKVRQILEDCLQLSLKKLRYDCKKMGTSFSLACPHENCSQLHEVKAGKTSWFLHCSACSCKLRLPESGLCWFNEESDKASALSPSSADTTTSPNMVSSAAVESSSAREPSAQLTLSNNATSSTATQSSNSNSEDVAQIVVPTFSLRSLTLLKWADKDGCSQSLRLRDEMSSLWRDVGDLLEVSTACMDSMFAQRLGDVRQCCRDILQGWIKNGSSHYPATWEGLVDLLKDLNLDSTASTLKEALKMDV